MTAKILLFGTTILVCSGCTYGGITGYGDDFVELRGTPDGLASLTEYTSAIVTNSKASSDASTPYWETRRLEAAARLQRYTNKNKGEK